MLMGETLSNVATDMDIYSYRTPLGVTGGIVPFNFPAMIPLWMFPVSISCGNTCVIKVQLLKGISSGCYFENRCILFIL